MQIKHKFYAKPVYDDGFHFPSKLERDYYRYLKHEMETNKVLFFLRQVPFHLPGGTKYVCDFMIFHKDGNVQIVDCKGHDTTLSKTKRKQVESFYPVKIDIVKKIT